MNRLSNAFVLGVTLLAATLDGNVVSAQSRYDAHVAFDNSLTTPGYYYSDGEVVAPSQLELAQEKFPIEDKTCVTPPNCLRLNWRSGKGGDWRLRLNLKHHYSNFDLSGDTLSFWAYADTALSADAAPRIYVTDTKGSPGQPADTGCVRRASGRGSHCHLPRSPVCSTAPATSHSTRRTWRRSRWSRDWTTTRRIRC